MIRHVAALGRKPDQHPLCNERMTLSKLLNRLAASPWALSCTSFVVTALLIRSNGLSVF
jgi:hypothetical protein